MYILVCNVGSTSLKFKLWDMPAECLLAESKIERVGSSVDAIFSYCSHSKNIRYSEDRLCVPDYTYGIRLFLQKLLDHEKGDIEEITQIDAVGFKTVLAKGYYGVHVLTEDVLKAMEAYLFVAPAHNGPYIQAIRNFKELLPDTLLVGVFETAFHMTIPLERYMYAIPYEWYEQYGIKRMGYHGASHEYIKDRIEELYGATGHLISCHLGGSSSVCAIKDGKSTDNSFGFSLQTGIPHAGRAGDVDPYVIPFLYNEGLTMEQIDNGLSKAGGLLGLSGISGDLRLVEEAADKGNERAKLAIDVLVCAVVRYIGAYFAELGGLNYLVFTGGIGENSQRVRKAICRQLTHMGVLLDPGLNLLDAGERLISAPESPVKIYVIPANEEIGVARKTFAFSRKQIN